MKIFSLYRVELRRLSLSKTIWLTTALSLCAPLLGYSMYKPTVMTGLYIANPVLAGTTIGAILWAVIAIIEANRIYRSGTDSLTDSMISPISLPVARMMAMMTITAVVTGLCALIYLPYTAAKLEYLFTVEFYFQNYFVFMLPTWWISILFAEGFYQITKRVELSVILYALFSYFSFSNFASKDYFMRWLNPRIATYSDGFTSIWPMRIGCYTRLIWLCIAMGVWLFSLLCIRKYQNNLFYSFLKGLKKVYIPVLSVVFTVFGVLLWKNQPFIDHGPDEWILNENYYIGRTKVTNRTHYSIITNPVTGTISAKAEYEIPFPYKDESSLKLNPGYEIKSITYGGEDVDFRTVKDDVNGERTTYFTLSDDKNETLIIEYGGIPTQVKASSISSVVTNTVDADYVSLGGHTLVPWLNDYTCRGKITFDITIPDDLIPFLEYAPMTDFVQNQDGTKTWTSSCDQYIRDFTAGNYVVDTFTAADINIDFVYGEAYISAVEESNAKQAVTDVFEYCSEHYGKIVFNKNNHIFLMQTSSMQRGGYAFPGIVQWFENVLSPNTLNDSHRGANSNEIFIHEMIHQWWGGYGLICAHEDIWSSEGLTVYSTYRVVKEKYGTLYANEYYVDEWQKAVDSQNRNFYNRYPEYLDRLPERYQVALRTSNRGINWYKRMPLMILKAEELVGGEDKMDEILSQMYADCGYFKNEEFTYQDFLNYCGLTEEELYLD